MPHDTHFLSRLERIESRPELEFALGLYRQPELVAYLLTRIALPAAADRVALCLNDGERGPYVVVARDGGFVTCLGEGMHHDLPVASYSVVRHQVDKVEQIRDRLASSRQRMGASGNLRDLVARVLDAGAELSREDFVAVSAWQPLMPREIYELLFACARGIKDSWAGIEHSSRKGDPEDHAAELAPLWKVACALGHLTLLVGMDDRQVFKDMAANHPEAMGVISQQAIELNNCGIALRGAWSVARFGKPVLGIFRSVLAESHRPVEVWNAALGLAALGVRQTSLAAQVRRAFATTARDQETATSSPATARAMLAELMLHVLEDVEAATRTALDAGRQAYHRTFAELPEDEPGCFALPDQVPDDLAVAALGLQQGTFIDSAQGPVWLSLMLPAVVRAHAEHLYLPENTLVHLRRTSPALLGRRLLEGMRAYRSRTTPVRKQKQVGRNDPCPCGSGAKYKRCCGRI